MADDGEGVAEPDEDLVAEVGRLQTMIVELQSENESLRDRITRLESELGRNSENSSKPPAQDPVAPRKSRADRRRAAREAVRGETRRQGKQPGAPGAHLARRQPDGVVPHPPASCAACGEDLAAAKVVGEVCRQVIDIPKVTARATDHVAERRRCSCGHETLGSFPPEARAPVSWGPEVRALAIYLMDRQHLPAERTAELLGELLGAPVSTGWLWQVQAEAARNLEPFVSAVKDALASSAVLHADETGTRIGVRKAWVHTLTSNLLTLLAVHDKRGREAFADIGVLERFSGTLVHDGYSSYDGFEHFLHAQCGSHVLRHLGSVGKTATFSSWCEEMTKLLLDARDASEDAAAAGKRKVPTRKAAQIRLRYHGILDEAFSLLPAGPPPRRRHSGGWFIVEREAWNLASRLKNGADDVLRLLDDTAVPLTNNAAERSLRMVKLHDKISGTFRSADGARDFATIRSYIQTAAQNGENRLEVLRQLFTGRPWIPAVCRT